MSEKLLLEVNPTRKIITIQHSGKVEFNNLYRAIRKWESSSKGIAYSKTADRQFGLTLPDGSQSPNILVLIDNWKIESQNDISIINGFVTGRDKNNNYYKPIFEGSKGSIKLESNESGWKPSKKQLEDTDKLAKLFSEDWEILVPKKEIRRKPSAIDRKHNLIGLYWFLKNQWILDSELLKFAFPIKGGDGIPRKGLVRTYELRSDWNINSDDLKYLEGGILIKSGRILVEASYHDNKEKKTTSTVVKFRDRLGVEAVLGVKDLAIVLESIIESMPEEEGRMIGILGKWGRGKTFLLNETWELLKERKNGQGKKVNLKVELHAWKYTDTPAVWAYLYEQFAGAYYSDPIKCWFPKIRKRIVLNIYRSGTSALILFFSSLFFSIIIGLGIPLEHKISWLNKILTSIGFGTTLSLIYIYFKHKNTALELFKKYYKDISFEHVLGIQAEVQKELKNLLKAIKYFNSDKKVILFVEDIDRCPEEKVIQIIDSLRVMLEDEYL